MFTNSPTQPTSSHLPPSIHLSPGMGRRMRRCSIINHFSPSRIRILFHTVLCRTLYGISVIHELISVTGHILNSLTSWQQRLILVNLLWNLATSSPTFLMSHVRINSVWPPTAIAHVDAVVVVRRGRRSWFILVSSAHRALLRGAENFPFPGDIKGQCGHARNSLAWVHM